MKRIEREIEIYEFIRKTIGRKFLGCDLKRIFGISYKTAFYRTALRKYTIHCGKTGPHKSAPHMYEINDVIWASEELLKKNDIIYRFLWTTLLGLNLVEKKRIPWYLLEEHGGSITDHELQDAYKAKFPFGPP